MIRAMPERKRFFAVDPFPNTALKDKRIPKIEVCPPSGKNDANTTTKQKLTPSFKRNLAEILSERDAISKVIRRKGKS